MPTPKKTLRDEEPYIRSFDGATMVAISPGSFVNEAVLRKFSGK